MPDLLKRAILLLVAHWYEFRATSDRPSSRFPIPPAYDRLIAAYRARRL